jgi:hypothetical protein
MKTPSIATPRGPAPVSTVACCFVRLMLLALDTLRLLDRPCLFARPDVKAPKSRDQLS